MRIAQEWADAGSDLNRIRPNFTPTLEVAPIRVSGTWKHTGVTCPSPCVGDVSREAWMLSVLWPNILLTCPTAMRGMRLFPPLLHSSLTGPWGNVESVHGLHRIRDASRPMSKRPQTFSHTDWRPLTSGRRSFGEFSTELTRRWSLCGKWVGRCFQKGKADKPSFPFDCPQKKSKKWQKAWIWCVIIRTFPGGEKKCLQTYRFYFYKNNKMSLGEHYFMGEKFYLSAMASHIPQLCVSRLKSTNFFNICCLFCEPDQGKEIPVFMNSCRG